jgi:hypothetical protein
MTSPTFCVGGPAGGGGAPGVPEPAAMVRSMFATSCRQPTASPQLGDSAQLAAVDVRAVDVFTRAPVTNLDPAECANQSSWTLNLGTCRRGPRRYRKSERHVILSIGKAIYPKKTIQKHQHRLHISTFCRPFLHAPFHLFFILAPMNTR